MPLKATAFPIRQPVLNFGSPAQPADTAPLVAIGEQSHTQRVHPESQTCSGTYSLRFRHPVDLGCTGAHDAWSSVWHLVGTSKFQESETWARISAATQGHRQSPTEEPDVGGFWHLDQRSSAPHAATKDRGSLRCRKGTRQAS